MGNDIENLISARKFLKPRVEKFEALGLSLEKAGQRLNEINKRLPYLEIVIQPIRAKIDDLRAVGGHISRAVVPATAVLKVFDAIHGLEKSSPDPQSDLPGYLGVLKRLKEALGFLGENCGMAIQWLADIVEYLEDHKVADERYILSLKKALENLGELKGGKERGQLDGGLLQVSLDRLVNEFRQLLLENSVPLPMASPILENEQVCIAPSPMRSHYKLDVFEDPRFKNIDSLPKLCRLLTKTKKSKIYFMIDRLIRLVLTFPVFTATTERAFSRMKLLKTQLRNKMEQEYLNNAMILYIEREIARDIELKYIIDRFDLLKNRRLRLK